MTARPLEPPWLVPRLPGLRVWALEPYYGGSHKAFVDGLRARSGHRIELHTLPGRHWRWRMHGGAFALAQHAASLSPDKAPQVLFASDMLDVATYLSLAPGWVRRAPVVAYFHENQLTYPLPDGVERDLDYAMKNLSTAVVADRLVFNSSFHREEFLLGLRSLLPLLP